MGAEEYITDLGDVRLCGGGGGGSSSLTRTSQRAALEGAVGRMIMDYWNGDPVRDPEAYLRSELGGEPLPTVSAVLKETFRKGFGATLAEYGLEGVRARAADALGAALAEENLTRPVTPGFRDMLMHLSESHSARVGLADAVGAAEGGELPTLEADTARAVQSTRDSGDGCDRGPRANRTALEHTLGSALIDYFNGFPVGDLRLRFVDNGGFDQMIVDALYDTFGSSFEATMRDRLDSADQVSLGERFGNSLRRCLLENGALRSSDIDFRDLNPKFGRRELRERIASNGGKGTVASESEMADVEH